MKTVFIDFGNVLGLFDHRRTVHRLLEHTDLTADALYDRMYANDLEEAYERGDLTTAEYATAAISAGRLRCPPDVFHAAFGDIFTPNRDVCDLIPALAKRYRLVLASNTNDAHFTHYSQQFADVLRHFSHLGASHRARVRKPHPDFFVYCQRYADALPHECVFIDDLEANISAAERHGWTGVLYRPGDDLPAKLRRAGIQIDAAGS